MNGLRWRIAQFFEIRWWNAYLKKKDPASYMTWKQAYWRDFLRKSNIHPQKGQSILDAGCGPAGIFTILDDLHPDALDPLLEQYEQLPHFSINDWPGTRFFVGDLESYSTDKKYDLIFCLNAINHVKDLPLCLDRLTALLQPGGTLVVSIDTHNYQWIKKVLRRIPGDILHPHQYDLEEYKKMLSSRGFTIEESILVKKEYIFNYWLLTALHGEHK
jgi:trans-aconitate methyltransferase